MRRAYYSVKFSLSPQKSSHGTFLYSLIVDLFKIPDEPVVGKRRHTAPAFETISYQVFGLVRNQRQFPSRWIDFNPRTYLVRPKTCYYQQQRSQYPIFFHKLDNNTGARARKQEYIYLSIYLSIWKPFWKRVYIYIYTVDEKCQANHLWERIQRDLNFINVNDKKIWNKLPHRDVSPFGLLQCI